MIKTRANMCQWAQKNVFFKGKTDIYYSPSILFNFSENNP